MSGSCRSSIAWMSWTRCWSAATHHCCWAYASATRPTQLTPAIAGGTFEINWSRQGAFGNVDIHYNTTGCGTSYSNAIQVNYASTPPLNWHVPDAITTTACIRVRANAVAYQTDIATASNVTSNMAATARTRARTTGPSGLAQARCAADAARLRNAQLRSTVTDEPSCSRISTIPATSGS